MTAFHHAHCGTHPVCHSLLYLFISPVSYYNLSLNAHTAYDMTILPVSVCGLVLIHEVHINGVIWDFLVKLGM